MYNNQQKFSYESDVRWLVEQARPYYFSIIFILIILGFYNLAFFYSLAALSLVWDVDELDRIDEDERRRKNELDNPAFIQRVVNLEIMIDYLESVSLELYSFNNLEYFNEYFNNLDNFLGLLSINNSFINEFKKDDIFINFKDNLIKLDEDQISKVITSRSDKEFIIKKKLFKLKKKSLSVSDPKMRAVLKSRMKKLIELSSNLEYELLQYKISIDHII